MMEVSFDNLLSKLELNPKGELLQRLVESCTSCKTVMAENPFIALLSNYLKEEQGLPKVQQTKSLIHSSLDYSST